MDDGMGRPGRPRAAAAVRAAAVMCLLGLLGGCAYVPDGARPDRVAVESPAVGASAASSPGATSPPASPAPAASAVARRFDDGRFAYEPGAIAWAQNATVAAANMSPPAPVAGYDWALLPMTIVNTSADPAAPGQFVVTLHAAGWSVSHHKASAGVVRMPRELRTRLLDPGQSLTGNLGFWLPSRAASDPSCWIDLEVWAGAGHGPRSHRFGCNP